MTTVLLIAFLSFLISTVSVLMVRRWFRRHAETYALDAPQRFHHGAVPRLGGVGVLLGWVAGVALIALLPRIGVPSGFWLDWSDWGRLTAVVLPAVCVGVQEDLTQKVPVRWRLFSTGVSGMLAVWLLDLSFVRFDVSFLDAWWGMWPVLGMGFCLLALMGLPHAFNIIDGYNGLAGVVATMICLALAHVSIQTGDRQLAAVALCLAGATGGFLMWNYPRGLIFAGDGGAYLWGVAIALIGLLLIQRHPEVSPWFVMLLLIYPVWETLFSIYRKSARGISPGMADALHLHQLIYRRLVRVILEDDEAQRLLSHNNRTTPYLLAFALMSVAPAIFFWRSTPVLIGFCLLFIFIYVGAYLMIVRFKTPEWLKR